MKIISKYTVFKESGQFAMQVEVYNISQSIKKFLTWWMAHNPCGEYVCMYVCILYDACF